MGIRRIGFYTDRGFGLAGFGRCASTTPASHSASYHVSVSPAACAGVVRVVVWHRHQLYQTVHRDADLGVIVRLLRAPCNLRVSVRVLQAVRSDPSRSEVQG